MSSAISAVWPVLRLKRGEERRLRAGHLWIFSNEVDNEATPLAHFTAGAAVHVRSHSDHFLGVAYVNPHALICARIVGTDPAQALGRGLIIERLRVAVALRERLGAARFGRLVFGESDLLPGLVLDRYDQVIVAQTSTAGMEALKDEIAAAVREALNPATLVWKNDSGARDLEQLGEYVEAAWGALPDEVRITEATLH